MYFGWCTLYICTFTYVLWYVLRLWTYFQICFLWHLINRRFTGHNKVYILPNGVRIIFFRHVILELTKWQPQHLITRFLAPWENYAHSNEGKKSIVDIKTCFNYDWWLVYVLCNNTSSYRLHSFWSIRGITRSSHH